MKTGARSANSSLTGGQVYVLTSQVPLRPAADGALEGQLRLRAGERRSLTLGYEFGEPAVIPLVGEAAERKLERTIDYWRGWVDRCTYDGPYRDAVARSALTVKLLTYSRSGGIVAAPTTSLPEQLGGQRNWDYRYCWLRDGAMTLRSLLDLGYQDEGRAFFSWLSQAVGGRQQDLAVLYDVYGNATVEERTLGHLAGFAAHDRSVSGTTHRSSSSWIFTARLRSPHTSSSVGAASSRLLRPGCCAVSGTRSVNAGRSPTTAWWRSEASTSSS